MNTTNLSTPPKKPSAIARFFQSFARLFGGKKKSKYGDWLSEGGQDSTAHANTTTDDFMNMNNVDANRHS